MDGKPRTLGWCNFLLTIRGGLKKKKKKTQPETTASADGINKQELMVFSCKSNELVAYY